MAETDTAILAELQKLNRTVSQGGSMGGGSELKGGASEPTAKDLADETAKKNEKAMRAIRSDLSKSKNAYVAANSAKIKSVQDLQAMEKKYSKERLEQFLKIHKLRKQQLIKAGEAVKQARELGYTARDLQRSEEDLIEETEELGSAFGKLSAKSDEQTQAGDKLKKTFMAVGAIVGAVGKQYADVQMASMRTGVEATAQGIVQSRMMGMTQEELIETQGRYRQVMEASGQTQDQFSNVMEQSSHSLLAFTGDLKTGAKFGAEAALMFRQLGASGMTAKTFQDKQAASFQRLNRTLSMTADEFMEMNKQLVESQTTRVQLFKMNKQRRAAYQLELVQAMEYLKVQGLTTEQAHKVVEAMQGIAGMDPKSRLKKAAQIQAMAGAIGMGAEGEELARLTRSGARDEGSIQRMAELSQTINTAVQARESGGFSSEMAMSALLNASGTGDTFGSGGTMADTTLAEGLKVNKSVDANTAKISGWETWLLKWYQISSGFLSEGWVQTILGGLTAIFATWFGGGAIITKILTSFTSVFGGIKTGIVGLANIFKTGMTSLLTGIGSMAKGMAGSVANMAKGLGSRLGTLAQGARVAAGPVAAAAAAAYGVQQAYQAITTGRSDVNDMLNSTETGRSIGDAIGSSIAHTMAFFGNDAAQEAIDINRRLEEQQAQANSLSAEMVASQKETNALQRRQIQTTEAQTEAVVGSNADTAQAANSNARSINIRAAGRRRN